MTRARTNSGSKVHLSQDDGWATLCGRDSYPLFRYGYDLNDEAIPASKEPVDCERCLKAVQLVLEGQL